MLWSKLFAVVHIRSILYGNRKDKKMKKIKCLVVVLLFALLITCIPTANVHAYTFYLGDWYYLESAVKNNMVVDVSGGSRCDGANIQIYQKNGSDAQLFKIVKSSNGYYSFINKGSNKAIDVRGGYTHRGANVNLWSKNGSGAQQWKLYTASGYPDTGYVTIMNRCGKYLDVNGGDSANGTNIQIWDRNNSKAQVFKMVPYVDYKYYIATFKTDDMKSYMQSITKTENAICSSAHGNGIIVSANVLSRSTVYWNIPRNAVYSGPGISGYIKVKYSVPKKVRYKVHTHQYNKGFGSRWYYSNQSIKVIHTCNCGFREEILEWEIPIPDTSDVQTTQKVIQGLPQISK